MDTSYGIDSDEWDKLTSDETSEEERQAFFEKHRRRLYWYWFKDASYVSAGQRHKVDGVLR